MLVLDTNNPCKTKVQTLEGCEARMTPDHKKTLADFRELRVAIKRDPRVWSHFWLCCSGPAFADAIDAMEAELAEAKQLLGEAACGDCGSNLRGRIEAFLTKGGA